MKDKPKEQHKVAVFLDWELFKLVKRAADDEDTSITQLLAGLAAKKCGYKPQTKPRKFKHAA